MLRILQISVVGLLLFAVPGSAMAQKYSVGAGLNLTGAPGVTGQHVFAGLLVPTRAPWLSSRLEGFLQTTEAYGTSVTATANLQLTPVRHTAVRPYLLGGGGVQLGRSGVLAANAGIGVEFRTLGRPAFVELVLRSFGTRTWQDGSFALSVGTAF